MLFQSVAHRAPLTHADAEPDASDTPEERLAGLQVQARLRAVWRQLPAQERRCVTLRAEGLRYREIARILNMSLGSVANTLSRAIGRLREEGGP